jgi:5-methylcytosine-specific restriction protein A
MAWPTTSRHARGYGREHEKIREQLLNEVVLCEECKRNGKTRVGNIADHIIPLSKGGKTERSNYQLLCKCCSNRKTIEDGGRKVRQRRIALSGWPEED